MCPIGSCDTQLVGLLERWDVRNQRIVDEQMKDPTLGMSKDQPRWLPVAAGFIAFLPFSLFVAVPLGGYLAIRALRRRFSSEKTAPVQADT